MTSRTCAHCGELFDDEGRLVCPHCGADSDFTYAETPVMEEFGEDEDAGYEDFLEREGLAEHATRKGCGAVLLLATGVPISAPLLLLL